MTRKEHFENLKGYVADYRARHGEDACSGPVPRGGNAVVYYYYDGRYVGDGELPACSEEEFNLDDGTSRFRGLDPETPWTGWAGAPAARDRLLHEVAWTAESRRKAFGPGSTAGPEVSADGRTCTVVHYSVDNAHEGEGDHKRWGLAWVGRIHPGEESLEVEVDLESGLSRERLAGDGFGRWSEWADPYGPDGCLGKYRTDEEIMAAAWDIVAHEDDPAAARLRDYTDGREWQGDDLYLLREAAIEAGRRSRGAAEGK